MESEPVPYTPFKPKSQLRRWIVFSLTLLTLIGVGMAVKPVYRAGKAWRSRQLAAEARKLMAAENFQDASQKARAAFQLKPDEPETIRTVAQLESQMGRSANSLSFWKQLKTLNARTIADRLNEAEDLVRVGSMAAADEEIKTILAENPKNAAALRVAVKIAAAQHRFEQSLDYAQQATASDPANIEGRLLYGLLQLDSQRPELHSAGMQSLMQIAPRRDKYALEAMLALSTHKDLPAEMMETLIPLLKDHPLATESQKLQALELEFRLRPNGREAFLDAMVAAGGTPEAVRAFGVWLNAHKEFERTLKAIPTQQALQRKDLLLVHLDALAALKRWPLIEQILSGKTVPLDGVYTELFLARSAMEQGQLSKADLHWRRAHLAAAPSPEQVWFLGNYAEKIGQVDQAEQAFRSLTSNATVARAAYEALLRLAEKQHDVNGSRDLLKAMHERWPSDAAVENDLAYLSLLKGLDLVDSFKAAQRLVAQTPNSLPHRTTLALAFYRLNQPVQALEVYKGLDVPWARVPPSQRLVYAAVLSLNNRKEEAKSRLAGLNLDQMRPEERALVEDLKE